MVANRTAFGQPVPEGPPSGMGELIFKAIIGLTNALKERTAGFIESHVREVLGLVPEIIRVNLITFHCRLSSAGVITQPANVRLSTDYDFELTGLTASFQQPSTNPIDFGQYTFQMRESGRNYDVFDTGAVNLLPFVSTAGPGSMIEWPRGLYLFRAGAEIQPVFAIDTTGGTFGGTARGLVVLLVGNYIRNGKKA